MSLRRRLTPRARKGRSVQCNWPSCAHDPDAWPIRLSERFWQRVWQYLLAHDALPRPYANEYEARVLVLAALYRALTGVDSEQAFAGALEADDVRAALQQWGERHVLDGLSELLGIQLSDP